MIPCYTELQISPSITQSILSEDQNLRITCHSSERYWRELMYAVKMRLFIDVIKLGITGEAKTRLVYCGTLGVGMNAWIDSILPSIKFPVTRTRETRI